jgi:hypothetical protein
MSLPLVGCIPKSFTSLVNVIPISCGEKSCPSLTDTPTLTTPAGAGGVKRTMVVDDRKDPGTRTPPTRKASFPSDESAESKTEPNSERSVPPEEDTLEGDAPESTGTPW